MIGAVAYAFEAAAKIRFCLVVAALRSVRLWGCFRITKNL